MVGAAALAFASKVNFFLTPSYRFILPLLGEYVDSGYRKPKDRAFYSLRANGRYQLIIALCAAAAAIYVFLVNGFEGGSVKSLVMA